MQLHHSAKYRLYDLIDDSKELVFPGHVINDRTLVNEPRVNGQWGYMKQNAELDDRWRFGEPVALTAGLGWERWDRSDHREVPTSNEYFGKLALDATPVDWFLGRLTYIPVLGGLLLAVIFASWGGIRRGGGQWCSER